LAPGLGALALDLAETLIGRLIALAPVAMDDWQANRDDLEATSCKRDGTYGR